MKCLTHCIFLPLIPVDCRSCPELDSRTSLPFLPKSHRPVRPAGLLFPCQPLLQITSSWPIGLSSCHDKALNDIWMWLYKEVTSILFIWIAPGMESVVHSVCKYITSEIQQQLKKSWGCISPCRVITRLAFLHFHCADRCCTCSSYSST
jgi:hypothetical protein